MAHKRATYLKTTPTQLAEIFDYNILPAIAALEADGVPKAEVQRLLHRAKTNAQRLLAECETVRLRLQAGIGSEYRAMRQGENHLYGLLSEARAIATLPPQAPPRERAFAPPLALRECMRGPSC